MTFLLVLVVFGIAAGLILIPVAISESRSSERDVTPPVYRADMPNTSEENEPNGRVSKILADPSAVSLKRIAWAFGCAKKDSEEEEALYRVLVARVDQVRAERGV